MAQSPKGGLYGPPSKGHLGVCAIYSETTVHEHVAIIDPFWVCSGLEMKSLNLPDSPTHPFHRRSTLDQRKIVGIVRHRLLFCE